MGAPGTAPHTWKASSLYPAPTFQEALKTYKHYNLDTDKGAYLSHLNIRAIYMYERVQEFRGLPILQLTTLFFQKHYDFEMVELSETTYLDLLPNLEILQDV